MRELSNIAFSAVAQTNYDYHSATYFAEASAFNASHGVEIVSLNASQLVITEDKIGTPYNVSGMQLGINGAFLNNGHSIPGNVFISQT